jgi:hypothetical protein
VRGACIALALLTGTLGCASPPSPAPAIDPTTLTGKIVCGYQGWFLAPGDGNPPEIGWRHWSHSAAEIGPGLYSVDMWPDVSEYASSELFPAPGVTLLDGSEGRLFSSITPETVDRHFAWMEECGIDGVLLQRFISELADGRFFTIRNTVLENVRRSANAHGRIFAVEYDTSGTSPADMFDRITADWKYLVDTVEITSDPRYLHHEGKPVVEIWGLGFEGRGHTPALAHQILDFFQDDPVYGGNCVIGGIPAWWRERIRDSESDPGWDSAYRRFDVINPWMVGRFRDSDGIQEFKEDTWPADMQAAAAAGAEYLPVVWPGFSWDNLMRHEPGTSLIPRRGGEFFWEQIHALQSLGAEMMFVAMFDEVDESTAIYKVSENHPVTGTWVTYEGLPSDWYLRLVGAASQMLRGEIPLSAAIPISPEVNGMSVR